MSVSLDLVNCPTYEELEKDENLKISYEVEEVGGYNVIEYQGEESLFWEDGDKTSTPNPIAARAVEESLLRYLNKKYKTVWFTDAGKEGEIEIFLFYCSKGLTNEERRKGFKYLVYSNWKERYPELWLPEFDQYISSEGKAIAEKALSR